MTLHARRGQGSAVQGTPVGDHHVALVAVVHRVQAVVGAGDDHAPVGVVLRAQRGRRLACSTMTAHISRASLAAGMHDFQPLSTTIFVSNLLAQTHT